MKPKLEIIAHDGRYAIVSGHDTIKHGDKVINSRNGNILHATEYDGSIGRLTPDGVAFLYFQPHHRKFIKYITVTDLKRLTTKKRRITWGNKNCL